MPGQRSARGPASSLHNRRGDVRVKLAVQARRPPKQLRSVAGSIRIQNSHPASELSVRVCRIPAVFSPVRLRLSL